MAATGPVVAVVLALVTARVAVIARAEVIVRVAAQGRALSRNRRHAPLMADRTEARASPEILGHLLK